MDESNIPIDINIGKLQDWLLSRRHVNKEWQKNILNVREKINNAIQDMPAHDGIAELLSGSHINYFHCLKIIDILKETEADSKNLFGRYGSQRMKDWLDVVKNYEKENLYLAEAAQMLVRNINYEVPGLKKQIAKEEQLQIECEKKVADCLKGEAASKSEFLTLCKQLGIKGDKIKKELVNRLQELPAIYDEIGSSLKPILPAIDLYTSFSQHMLGEGPPPLPLLRYVAERGNTTTYEWRHGAAPARVRRDPVPVDGSDGDESAGGGDKIDFGDGDPIDFGSVDAGETIDFGSVDNGNAIDFGDGDVAADIDWGTDGIVVEDSKITEITVEDSGEEASGADAASLLDNPQTRAQVIAQLVELESFLKMRVFESSQQDGGYSLTQLECAPLPALAAMLAAVQSASGRLLAPELTHLHNVKHSPRYVDMLTAQLQQKLSLCAKMSSVAERSAARRRGAGEAEARLRPLLARLIDNCRSLQGEIEKDISKKYKGRPVNIIGGVKFL